MTWVAWRQHRTELLIMLAILAGMATLLIPSGLDHWATFQESGLESCLQTRGDCWSLIYRLEGEYESLNQVVPWFNFAPAVIGMLLAAPLISEFEQRTYRLAWTQSIPRDRWLAMKFGVVIAGVATFSVLLTLLMTWWHTPLDRSVPVVSSDLGQGYDFEGLMPFSYTLFAAALALAAGVLSRRALVAMPVALVGFFAMRMAIQQLLREGVFSNSEVTVGPGDRMPAVGRDMERFWTVQAQEAAIFLSLAVVLLAITFWVARRRAS